MAGDGCSLTPGPLKSAPFQLFDIHGETVPVPLQKSDLVEPFAKEHKDITGHGVGTQFIADKAGKGIDPEAHICRFPVQVIATGIRKGKHGLMDKFSDKTRSDTFIKFHADP